MKNKIPYIIIAILLVIIWFKSCGNSEKQNTHKTNTHKIIIPEIKGSFEPKKDIKHNPIKLPSNKEKVSKSTGLSNDKLLSDIQALYNENEALKQAYIDSDSLKREIMYLKSIQLSEFYREFDNDTINILIKGIAQGEVKQIQPFYTIKERTQNIIIPETKFRFLVGGTIGNTKEFNNPLFSAGVGFQNRKGNILLSSIDTEKRLSISYYQSVFKIKKP